MKKLLLLLLIVPALALAQKTPKGVTYDAQIVRVNDGDTVDLFQSLVDDTSSTDVGKS